MKKRLTYQVVFLAAIILALFLIIIFTKLDDVSIALGIAQDSLALIWIYSLVSVALVSAISLVGLFTIGLHLDYLKKILLFLVSVSIGTLLGGAFIHLIPEAVEVTGFTTAVSFYILLGIIVFFIVEKFVHWQHCHTAPQKGHTHSFAKMNLIGDGVHNLLDGLIIGGS